MKTIGSTTCPSWQRRLGDALNSYRGAWQTDSSVKVTDFWGGVLGFDHNAYMSARRCLALRFAPDQKTKVTIVRGQKWQSMLNERRYG